MDQINDRKERKAPPRNEFQTAREINVKLFGVWISNDPSNTLNMNYKNRLEKMTSALIFNCVFSSCIYPSTVTC